MKNLVESLLGLLARRDYVPLDASELLRELDLPAPAQSELNRALKDLEQSGRIACIKGNRYIQSLEADLIPGRIRMNRQGKGFLQPDAPDLKEIAIPESATGTALHEDRVLVRRDVRARGLQAAGARDVATGTVVRILERRRTRIVGTLQRSRQFLFVVPDDPRIPHDIYVPPPRDVGRAANVGDKVVVELGEWTSRHTNPEGEVVEVLGPPDTEGVDMLSVLRQYDLPLRFPKNVLTEARAFGTTVTDKDLRDRVDCRRHPVITIDPDDAKDFDDAICLERTGPDEWRLWVHIADVSHYVRPGGALDVEARKRGNSTYLVDRVIPMLPEGLSNELCSLKPGVDRLTKCVQFVLSNDGRVLNTRIYSAVIHSQQRFSYQEALAVLNRTPATPIERMLHQAHELAQILRRARFKAGSLELDFPEMKIRLDERGRIARIDRIENDVSHQLIEEYMLLANEAVATRLMSIHRPSIYRVHEEPDEHRLREYREEVLSHHVPCGNLRQRAEVQRLLRKLSTLAIGPALKIGFLKSLLRARYAVEPLGHYGLAKSAYTHFTSPIRRYADLVVHRALFEQQPASTSALREIAGHLSVTERNSSDAERDSKDVKLFAFLEAQLESRRPIAYPALVTDVRNFGFFVDVTGLAMSGLVPLSTLDDDFYLFDDTRAQLVGRRSRRVIRLGDRLTVQVAKVNRFKRQVDFRLAAEDRTEAGHPATQRPRATRGGERSRRGEVPTSRLPSRPLVTTPARRVAESVPRTPPPAEAPRAPREARDVRDGRDARDTRRPGQESRRPAPESRRSAPESRQPAPESRRPVVEPKRFERDARRPAPQPLPRSHESSRSSFESRSTSPEVRRMALERSRQAEDARRRMSEPLRPAPETRRPVAEPSRRDHDVRRSSPEVRSPVQDSRRMVQEPRRASEPPQRSAPRDPRRSMPDSGRANPEPARREAPPRRPEPRSAEREGRRPSSGVNRPNDPAPSPRPSRDARSPMPEPRRSTPEGSRRHADAAGRGFLEPRRPAPDVRRPVIDAPRRAAEPRRPAQEPRRSPRDRR